MAVTAEDQELRGIDIAVHKDGIQPIGNVVETATQGPVVAEQVKALFELQVQVEIGGEAALTGRLHQFLQVVVDVERKSRPGFGRVGQVEVVDDGKIEEGKKAPREKAVGSVPGEGTGGLGAEKRIVDVEIKHLV